MPKKGKAPPATSGEPGAGAGTAACGGARAEGAAAAQEGCAEGQEPPRSRERTFTAPSGKHYVLVQDNYPQQVGPGDLGSEVVTAAEGDLLELLLLHDCWAYGRRFKARSDAVNEGVFRLDWVHGVKLTVDGGQRRPVEVDVHSAEFGFHPPRATDAAAKLRLKRYRKKIDDAAKAWGRARAEATGPDAESEAQAAAAAAAEAAAALERADANERARKQKAELRRQQQLQQQRQHQQHQQHQQQQQQGQRSPQQPHRPQGADDEVAVQPLQPARDIAGQLASSPGSSCGEEEASWRRPGQAPRRRPLSMRAWEAQWEQQAAHLERELSASSSGVEESLSSEGSQRRRPTVQKKIMRGKFARMLLQAKRSGELQAIAEEWEKAHTEMASKASDLSALNAKVKRSLLNAHRVGGLPEGDLERIAEEMVDEAERKAAEVKALKERVFRAMFDMKRARDLEKTTSDMEDAQKELEMKALQLKSLMKKAWQGMVESRRQSELERIADEMAEQLKTKADSLRKKIREGLLRAHRAGELWDMRNELDELADSVPAPQEEDLRGASWADRGGAEATPPPRRRWADYPSSDSDSARDTPEALRDRLGRPSVAVAGSPALAHASSLQQAWQAIGEADVSGSEAESSAGPGSPPAAAARRR